MSLIKIRAHKRGFILLLVMFIISALTLLITSVSLQTFTAKSLTSTFMRRQELKNLTDSGIALALAQLFKITYQDQEKQKESDSSQKKAPPEKVTQPGTTEKTEKKTDEKESKSEKDQVDPEKVVEGFYNLLYHWNTFSFEYTKDGFDGTVRIYFMCEDSKLPLMHYITAMTKKAGRGDEEEEEDEDANKKDPKSPNDPRSNDPQSKKPTPKPKSDKNKKEATGSDAETSEESSQSPFATEQGKKFEEMIKKLVETSAAVAALNLPSNKGGAISFKTICEKYIARKEILPPESLYAFYGEYAPAAKLYPMRTSSEKTENYKATPGELWSVYNQKCNLVYLAPAVLQSYGIKIGQEFTPDQKKKVLEKIKELVKGKSGDSLDHEEVWNQAYKNIFSLTKEAPEFSDAEIMPKCLSALIMVEYQNISQTIFVVFEKTAASGKNSRGYLVRQIYHV